MKINKLLAVVASVLVVGSSFASNCAELCSDFSLHSVEKVSSNSSMPCHEGMSDQGEQDSHSHSKSKSCLGDLCLSFDVADSSQKLATLEKISFPENSFLTGQELPVVIQLMRISPPIDQVDRRLWISSIPIFLRIQRFLT